MCTHRREERQRRATAPRPRSRPRRAQWPGYKPAPRCLSTVLSTNRRNAPKKSKAARSPDLSGARAALEPHSCDVLFVRYVAAGRNQAPVPRPGRADSDDLDDPSRFRSCSLSTGCAARLTFAGPPLTLAGRGVGGARRLKACNGCPAAAGPGIVAPAIR